MSNNEIILQLLAQNNRVLANNDRVMANNEKIISMLQTPNQSFINSIPNTDIKQLEEEPKTQEEKPPITQEEIKNDIIKLLKYIKTIHDKEKQKKVMKVIIALDKKLTELTEEETDKSSSSNDETISISSYETKISVSSEEFNDDDSSLALSEISCDVTDDNTDTNSEYSNYTTTSSSSSSSSYTDTSYYTTTSSSSSSSTEIISRKPTKKIKQKTNKRKEIEFVILTEEKNSYSPEEIENMTDCELLIHFMRITQKHKLYCSHCHRNKSLDYWVHSIRKRCMKKDGLCSEMKLPKTCDHQQAVNSISNTINNKVYRTLRDPRTSERHKQQIMQAKAEFFEKLDKEVRPYKY